MTDEERIARLKAQRARQKLSRVFEMPDIATRNMLLNEDEIAFFKEQGFLIKPGLVEAEKVAEGLDEAWSHLLKVVPTAPNSDWQLHRDDRASWINPQWATMPPHPTSGYFQGRQPVEYMGRMVKLHDIGTEPLFRRLLPEHPSVVAISEALLGEELRPCSCTRGVYALFPTHNQEDPEGERRLSGASLGPHVDQVCQQLNLALYLDDVVARNGGFTIYPGSHRLVFPTHEYEANFSPGGQFGPTVRRIAEEIEPLELTAPAGSVIFWHGRLVHTPGVHTGEDIRWALFGDMSFDREVLDDDEHREVGQYEWFKNTRLFRQDDRVTDDMWRSWSLKPISG